MKKKIDVFAMLQQAAANQAKTDILIAFALLEADPHKRVGAIADYVSAGATTLERDDIMLAFHLAECFPALSPEAIDKAVTALVDLSQKIHKLDMIAMNDRPLRAAEKDQLAMLQQQAELGAQSLGVGIEFCDPRSGAGFALRLPNRKSNNMGGEAWNVGCDASL